MLKYKLTLNQGNETLGSLPTITAKETISETVSAEQLAREMNHLNPLIPEQVAKNVIDNLGSTILVAIAEGKRVQLKRGSDTLLSIYADVRMQHTFDLTEARARGFEGEALTTDAAALVRTTDLVVRAKAETEPAFNRLLRERVDSFQRVGVDVREYVAKADSTNTAEPTTNPTDTTNPGGGTVPSGNTNPGGQEQG